MPEPSRPPKPSGKKLDKAAVAAAAKVPLPAVKVQHTAREILSNKMYGTPLPELGLGGRRRRRRGAGLVDVTKLPPLPKSAPPSPENSDDEEEKPAPKKRGNSPLAERLYLSQIKTKKAGSRKTKRKTHRRRR